MQKNTPLETMYMEYANTVKHFLISLCGNSGRRPDTGDLLSGIQISAPL